MADSPFLAWNRADAEPAQREVDWTHAAIERRRSAGDAEAPRSVAEARDDRSSGGADTDAD